jgi:hypothetical protein
VLTNLVLCYFFLKCFSINQIRFNRFENALRSVLESYSERLSSQVATSPPPPAPAQNTRGRQNSTASTTSTYNSATNTVTRQSVSASNANTANANSVLVTNLEDAREYVRRVLGHYYMDMHGVGEKNEGFNVHIEDARMVLKAFWVMSESRLHADIESTVDQMVLQKISERVEQELLSRLQIWGGSGQSLSNMLAIDASVTKKRKELVTAKAQYNEALKRIHEISPITIANMASPSSSL